MSISPVIPPIVVHVKLRMRCSFETRYWTFCRYAPVEYQLDSALLLFEVNQQHPAFEDAVGILVNGIVYVDDEPYWKNLLIPGATYDVVYVRRPLWHYGLFMSLWIRLCDLWHETPTIESQHVRSRRPEYCTRQAYSRLRKTNLVLAKEKRPCTHNEHLYWHWNERFEEEIVKAKEQGRRIVYDRMRLFNPLKEHVN